MTVWFTLGCFSIQTANASCARQAQLRGIPVISTAACGLKEANFLEAHLAK